MAARRQRQIWNVFWLTVPPGLITMQTTQMEKSGRMNAPEEYCRQKKVTRAFSSAGRGPQTN
jgi:hypothetical protein